MNLDDIIIIYQKRINNVLKKFIKNIKLKNSILFNAVKYSTLLGGKRLRPLLVYATGSMLNANLIDLDIPAAAIEFVHSYSLIHDDLPVMDNDNLRRGRPTCHIKFGENIAILAGNTLQTLAFSILSEERMKNVTLKNRLLMISTLSKAIGIYGICRGQELELITNGKNINLKILEEIYKYKTGSLIKAAVRLGVLTSNYRKYHHLTELDRYSNAISMAFQIKNDILDIIGNIENTGRYNGSDKKLKKNTYPRIIGIKKAKLKILYFYHEAIKALKNMKEHSINIDKLQYLTKFIINFDK